MNFSDIGKTDPDSFSPVGGNALFLLILFGVSAITIAKIAELGLKVTPDSITYYNASLSLLAGEGLREGTDGKYLTHFPPLIPVALGFIQLFHQSINSFVVLNSICLISSAFLLYFLCLVSFHSRTLAFAISGCFIVHPITLSIHRAGLSEPLYLTFTLLTLLAVSSKWNFPASIGAALTIMTRYAGGHFLLFLPSIVLLPRGKDLSLKAFGLLISCPLIALLLWMIRNVVVAENLTGRSGVKNSTELFFLFQSLVQTVSIDWVFAEHFPARGLLTLCVLFFPLAGLIQKRTSYLSLAYITSLIFVFGSRLLVDGEIPINGRILYVPFVLALTLIIGIPGSIVVTGFGQKVLFSILAIVLVGFGAIKESDEPRVSAFESSSWQQSKELQYLTSRDQDQTILFSNAEDFLSLYGKLKARSLPNRYDAGSRIELENSLEKFKAELEELQNNNPNKEILFAFSDLVHWRWYLWEEKALVESLGLQKVEESGKARVFTLPNTMTLQEKEN